MQDNRSLLGQNLAPQEKKKKQKLLSASALIIKDLQDIFSPGSAPRASLFGRLIHALQLFGFFHVVSRFLGFFFCSWQAEKNGVMGGHTRRSKHAARTSSTVLCDSTASLEDWKEQIKLKGSIPANQQRLTFTSQRLIKQPLALANFGSNRQWHIILNASAEGICEDLRHWRAILRSKNTSAELLQPLVLKETDELATLLHSKTAKQLRSIGVPCNVFFLSFDTWIPNLQSGILEEQALPIDLKERLDLKIDEEFCHDVFLIKLCGDLNGLRLPMPISYVMNGNELASKLSMVEQTAHYREKQRQRYCQYSAPALEESKTQSNQASVVNYGSSDVKDYILEFDQNYEFAAFISKDNRRLRCIVLPIITISLGDARGSSEVQSFLPLRGYSVDAVGESTSNVLALPSTSQSGEESTCTSRSINEEVPVLFSSECVSTQKASKKKKKKKAKKAAKGNSNIIANFEAAGNKATDQFSSSCEEAAAEILNVDVATVDDVKHPDPSDHEEPNTLTIGVEQNLPGSEPKDEDFGGSHPLQEVNNTFVEETQEVSSSIKQSSLVSHLPVQLEQNASDGPQPDSYEQSSLSTLSSTQEICLDKTLLNQYDRVVDGSEVQEDLIGVDNASWLTDTPMSSTTSTIDGGMHTESSLDVAERKVSNLDNAGEIGASKQKPFENQSRVAHRENTRQHEVVADNTMTSFDHHNGRWEHSSHRNSNRHNFWTHQVFEGQDHFSHRSRTNQDSFSGDARSSAASWRRQRSDSHGTKEWTRARFSRPEQDWSAERGFRNMATWEQLPNLRQPSSGSRFSNHWDNNIHDEFWLQGKNHSSFNMQQRKYGKRNRVSQHYVDKRQLQQDSNDTIPSNLKVLTALPLVSNVDLIQSNSNDDSDAADHNVISGKGVLSEGDVAMARDVVDHGGIAGKSLQSEGRIGMASCTTAQKTTSSLLGNGQLPSESESSGNQLSKVVQHVCNILDAVNMSSEASCVYGESLNGEASCEFEKLATSVAPAFKASLRSQCWKHMGCSCRSLGTGFPNSRQVPDVALSTLWQWYEEPSCYGLKVKLSGCGERTHRSVQAFFVPYLSGIQLFGWPRRRKGENKDKAVAQKSSPFDSGFLSDPIFSILLPRPNSCSGLITGARQKADDVESGATQGHCHCDVELLYEFFEDEKPQQRKPFIDRINELVSNHADAEVLNTANMKDLHPSSWFAVAWYPIYKIPDETFRSAFLTYHCFGSLRADCSESSHSSSDKSASTVTAPVVGLMSFNAQAKDWFTLTAPSPVDASDLLQQYLAKLEVAAASMSRGSSDPSSSFKHADFLFFQSRGR